MTEQNTMQPGDVDQEKDLEILRYAIALRDHEARETLEHQFTENVRFWLTQHACRDAVLRYESEQDYVDRTFQRFWQAISDQGLTFTSLAGALRYLRLCLHSAIMDTLRLQAHARLEAPPEQDHSDEPQVGDRYNERELWKTISKLLANEQERRVAYLHFCCNLKPREIIYCCPDEFSSEEEIYQLKRHIMERITRNIDKLR